MQQAAATGYKFLILTNTLTGTNVKMVINVKGGGSVNRNHGSHSLLHRTRVAFPRARNVIERLP